MQVQDSSGPYSSDEPSQAPAPIAARGHAFFFDMDGTLAPIAGTPGEVSVPPATASILQRLVKSCEDAVAIVSGRPLAEIDQLLDPLRLTAAGLHGAQWRNADGTTGQLDVDRHRVAQMAERLQPLLDRHPGLLLEHKAMALALHYRHAPDCAQLVQQEMERLAVDCGEGFVLQPGKMVVEIKPAAASKAKAIERFMQAAPFAGRIPVFAGDDLTDEAGFAVVNALGGVSIKIGGGASIAQWRLPDPKALAQWMTSLN